jgi:hypothetical protein
VLHNREEWIGMSDMDELISAKQESLAPLAERMLLEP